MCVCVCVLFANCFFLEFHDQLCFVVVVVVAVVASVSVSFLFSVCDCCDMHLICRCCRK